MQSKFQNPIKIVLSPKNYVQNIVNNNTLSNTHTQKCIGNNNKKTHFYNDTGNQIVNNNNNINSSIKLLKNNKLTTNSSNPIGKIQFLNLNSSSNIDTLLDELNNSLGLTKRNN